MIERKQVDGSCNICIHALLDTKQTRRRRLGCAVL